jgi:hypothetical protein
MPISFHLDPRRDTVLVRGTGTLSLDEVLRLLDDLAVAGPQIRGKNGVIDAAHATDTQMTFDSIRRISDRVSQMEDLFRNTRWAVVAPDDALFGVARMYETLRSGGPFEVRVFRSASDAEAWVRRDDAAL